MKDEYISRQAAIDALHTKFRDGFSEDKWWNSTHVLAAIEALPAADVVPVVYSTWIKDEGERYHGIHCLRCGFSIPYGNVLMGYKFCPNCGAKMDGERKE